MLHSARGHLLGAKTQRPARRAHARFKSRVDLHFEPIDGTGERRDVGCR